MKSCWDASEVALSSNFEIIDNIVKQYKVNKNIKSYLVMAPLEGLSLVEGPLAVLLSDRIQEGTRPRSLGRLPQ